MHQFVHKTNIQYIKKWHHIHHIDYPPGKPISSIYINSTGPIYKNIFLHMCIPIWLLIFYIFHFKYFILFCSYSSIYLSIANHLHIQYHLTDSYLDHSQWFQRNKKLHIIHHKKYMKNMNIIDHTCDKNFLHFRNKLSNIYIYIYGCV